MCVGGSGRVGNFFSLAAISLGTQTNVKIREATRTTTVQSKKQHIGEQHANAIHWRCIAVTVDVGAGAELITAGIRSPDLEKGGRQAATFSPACKHTRYQTLLLNVSFLRTSPPPLV